jgi:hypothetical protein
MSGREIDTALSPRTVEKEATVNDASITVSGKSACSHVENVA